MTISVLWHLCIVSSVCCQQLNISWMGIDYNIVVMTGLVSILANCPGISGWKLTSCPSVLEAFKLSRKLFTWQNANGPGSVLIQQAIISGWPYIEPYPPSKIHVFIIRLSSHPCDVIQAYSSPETTIHTCTTNNLNKDIF